MTLDRDSHNSSILDGSKLATGKSIIQIYQDELNWMEALKYLLIGIVNKILYLCLPFESP